MIDCTQLRSQILTLLADIIGTYRYSDGYEEAAIAVIPDEDRGFDVPGNGTRSQGIEIIISRPVPEVKHFLAGGKQLTYRWIITLKQWDASKSLIEATQILIDNLDYLITSPKLVPPNAALGIIEQMTMQIVEHDFQKAA